MEGIEFRLVTVEAFKGKQGPCFERNQAVIYRGPFKAIAATYAGEGNITQRR